MSKLALLTPTGEVNPLDHLPLTIGSLRNLAESHNGICVRATDGTGRGIRSYVSQRHAEISASSGSLFLRDLGSANGTFLNGERITQNAVMLKADDVFTLSKHSKFCFTVICDPRVCVLPTFVPRQESQDEQTTTLKSWLMFLRANGFKRFLQATSPLTEEERKTLQTTFSWAHDAETRRMLCEAVGLANLAGKNLEIIAANLGIEIENVDTFLNSR